MSDEANKLKAVGDFIGGLTPRSLLLGVLAGFFGIGLWTLFDNRAAVFTYIVGSPYLLVGIGVGLVLIAFGWVVSILLRRVEEFMQKQIDKLTDDSSALKQELVDVRAQLHECQEECRAGTQHKLDRILEKLNA